MATDEDAEVKRTVLQLIFINDLEALSSLLQCNQAKFGKGNDQAKAATADKKQRVNNYGDMYEFNCQQNNNNGSLLLSSDNEDGGKPSVNLDDKIRNLNWHDQHIKTNLDLKITPLTQAAYLGRK